jgi:SAM-dependent methyltransferase
VSKIGDKSVRSTENLTRRLELIGRAFNLQDFLASEYGPTEISKYYSRTFWGYSLLHSVAGSVHMAVSSDDEFRKSDYSFQPKFVDAFVKRQNARRVLELGTGRGFNTIFLAERNPTTSFIGIDITEDHLAAAKRKAQKIENVRFELRSFDELEFGESEFDLVFEVESICHSRNMKKLLCSIHESLRPGGVFIVIDGFRGRPTSELNDDEERSLCLVERVMAVHRFWEYSEWKELTKSVGFQLEREDDLSKRIMPNIRRFEKMAKIFFSSNFVSRFFKAVLPFEVVQNAIAGLLMPVTIESGMHRYFAVVLRKPTT